MAVHSAAVVDAQLVTDQNRIVVGQGIVESVPACNAADGEEDTAVGDAGEIDSIAADGQLDVEIALIRCGVENLEQADVDAFVREDLHRINFRPRRVLKIGRHYHGR